MPEEKVNIEQLTKHIVHKIRTPLTVIQMLSYTLEKDLSAEDPKKKDLKTLRDEVTKVDKYLEQFSQDVKKLGEG
jgi:signal transduction histidine kinase